MLTRHCVRGIAAGVLLWGLLGSCVKETQPAGRDEASALSDLAHVPLAVYRFDPLNGRLYVTRTIGVEPEVSRHAALEALLARVNGTLSGRLIRLAGVDQKEQGDILVLDMVDPEETSGGGGWYNAFQGSAGGAATQGFLVATFLQPAYRGNWFDGVRFLLNGEPISEMDHVNLSGVFLRSEPMAEHMIVSMSEAGDVFVDRDGNGNLEILRRGELIDCGDDCLCREGTVLESFETLYEWSPEEGRFVAVP